jgi:hypothetical protein
MVDVSLEYYDAFAVADGATPLGANGSRATVWLDSELAQPLPAAGVTLEFIYANGTLAAPPEWHDVPGGTLPPSRAVRLSPVEWSPPAAAIGEVLLVRLSLVQHRMSAGVASHGAPPLAQHTYAFALAPAGTTSTTLTAALLPLLRPPLSAVLRVEAMLVEGGGVAIDVTALGAAAFYVQLTLRRSRDGPALPFVSVRNHFLVGQGECVSVTATQELLSVSDGGLWACAEAWNNAEGRVCAEV